MTPDVEQMIRDSKLKDPTDETKNRVEILKAEFSMHSFELDIKEITFMSINGVDIYNLEQQNIVPDGIWFTFTRQLPEISAENKPTSVEWDEGNNMLVIYYGDTRTEYIMTDNNIGFFVGDFNANEKPTINSAMKAFVNWCNNL